MSESVLDALANIEAASQEQTATNQALTQEVAGKMAAIDNKVDEALQASIKSLTYTESKTIGPGADFETLNAAFEYYSAHSTTMYTTGSGTYVAGVVLKIKTGVVIQEQLLFGPGVDFGYIRIDAEDAVVYVDHTALTKVFASGRPLLSAARGAKLPQVNVLFEMNSDAGTSLNGIVVSGAGSSCFIYSGKGVKKAGGHGLLVEEGGMVSAKGADFSEASIHGIYAFNNGIAFVQGARVNNAGSCGCRAEGGSTIEFSNGQANDSDIGIYAYGESTIQAHSASCNDAKNMAAHIYASRVNLIGAIGERAVNKGLDIQMTSVVNAHSSRWKKGDIEDSTDVSLSSGSILNASGAFTGGKNIAVNTLTANGIIFG